MKEFCRRLHGRTVAEDLRLAGLMVDYDPGWNDFLKAHGKDFQAEHPSIRRAFVHREPCPTNH